jgi:hypothetical protein
MVGSIIAAKPKVLSLSHLDQIPSTLVGYKAKNKMSGKTSEENVYSPHTIFHPPPKVPHQRLNFPVNPLLSLSPYPPRDSQIQGEEEQFVPEEDDEQMSPLFHDPNRYKNWFNNIPTSQSQIFISKDTAETTPSVTSFPSKNLSLPCSQSDPVLSPLVTSSTPIATSHNHPTPATEISNVSGPTVPFQGLAKRESLSKRDKESTNDTDPNGLTRLGLFGK